MTRISYTLGWLCLVIAFVERVMLTTQAGLRMAVQANVLPRNFVELSVVFFVAAIASAQCCPAKKS